MTEKGYWTPGNGDVFILRVVDRDYCNFIWNETLLSSGFCQKQSFGDCVLCQQVHLCEIILTKVQQYSKRPKKNILSDCFAEYPSDLNGNEESDKLKSVTKCYTHIETSSNSADIDKMTNGETSSFWQSDGSARSHWIRWAQGWGSESWASQPGSSWAGLILAGCQLPSGLLHDSSPQLGRREKMKQKALGSRAGRALSSTVITDKTPSIQGI